MKGVVFAGALALAAASTLSISDKGIGVAPASAQEVVVTESVVLRIKSALRLSAAQEVHWRSIEAHLRKIARSQSRHDGDESVQPVRLRSYVLDAAAIDGLRMAAMPLFGTLTDEQKRDAKAAARSLGVGALF
jgi:hypothetical protein